MAFKFSRPKNQYTKQYIKENLSADMVDEYVRASRILNARITRLEKRYPRAELLTDIHRAPKLSEMTKNPFAGENSKDKFGLGKMLNINSDEFRQNPEGTINVSMFSSAYSNVFKYLNYDTTTITGFKRQMNRSIKTFNSMLDTDIFNESNIFDLYDFLRDYRQKYGNQKIPNSDQVIDIFAESVRLNIKPDSLLKDIEFWESHYEEMQNLEPEFVGETVDSTFYKSIIDDL